MPIYDIEKDDLKKLTDGQLEELVFRLAEAEVKIRGGRSSDVRWGGSLTAPDGGVDVRVSIQTLEFEGDYVQRPHTVFQVKKPKMPPAKIQSEMKPKGVPVSILSDLACLNGCYIIVSLTDDNSDLEYKKRIEAMESAAEGIENRGDLNLDFYDRSRLHAWLRQHLAVLLWVREINGKPLSGWRPFGSWSSTPIEEDDSLICEDGVRIIIPSDNSSHLSIEDAIPVVRTLINSSNKATRIVGLSGVGKTRFVQALFEEKTREGALDSTKVIYTDMGESPVPSPMSMLDTLVTENREAIIVLDNCSSELHCRLVTRLSKVECSLRLITVEYDIREEGAQATDVVKIEACGTYIAEILVTRRYPYLGQENARRIAKFSEGNARLALALAEGVGSGESLAKLTDTELFGRLFNQRYQEEPDLKESAEVLSLVYSFSVEDAESSIDELGLLGGLCEQTRLTMYRAASTLFKRDLIQSRARWRAVLPHAVANRLASEALNNIPMVKLIETFEQQGSLRLLKSFGRRLGYLHDHPVAQEIVGKWFSPKGILSDYYNLNEEQLVLFQHVAPVAPDKVLSIIENLELDNIFDRGSFTYKSRKSILSDLLFQIGYEPEYFERATQLLLKFAITENNSSYTNVRQRIPKSFQLYYSRTHAKPSVRESIIRKCLWSADLIERSIGAEMLSEALKTSYWKPFRASDFGAHSRDFGHHSNYQERIAWYDRFVSVAVDCSLSDSEYLEILGRKELAKSLRGLWAYSDLRELLLESYKKLNDYDPWVEGWQATCSLLSLDLKFDPKKKMDSDSRQELSLLEKELSPKDLATEVRALVIGTGSTSWPTYNCYEDTGGYTNYFEQVSAEAYRLGERCAKSDEVLNKIGKELFEGRSEYREPFGKGLLAASVCKRTTWDLLVAHLRSMNNNDYYYGVLCGALEAIRREDVELANIILDECANESLLKFCLVGLHSIEGFTEHCFDRCIAALEHDNTPLSQYGRLIWLDIKYISLDHLEILIKKLLQKDGGYLVVIEGLAMKLHGSKNSNICLGDVVYSLGMTAVVMQLRNENSRHCRANDNFLSEVIKACLPVLDNTKEKSDLIDALFEFLDSSYSYLFDYEETLQEIIQYLPCEFLNRVLLDSQENIQTREELFEPAPSDRRFLDALPEEFIINWCAQSEDIKAWEIAVLAIYPFCSNKKLGNQLTSQALMLLDRAPDPVKVIEAYFDKLRPKSYSGSLADILEIGMEAFGPLTKHKNLKIVDAVNKGVAETKELATWMRAEEQKRSDESDQRFE